MWKLLLEAQLQGHKGKYHDTLRKYKESDGFLKENLSSKG